MKIYTKRSSCEDVLIKAKTETICPICSKILEICTKCKKPIKNNEEIICCFGWSTISNLNSHHHKLCFENNYKYGEIIYLDGDESNNTKNTN